MEQEGSLSALRRLLTHAHQHRWWVVWASTFSILNKLFDLAPPLLIGLAVDTVVHRTNSFLSVWGVVDTTEQLYVIAGLTVLIWGLESVFEYLFARAWRGLAQTVQHELRMETYAHVQGLDQGWFNENSTGELMAVLNDDVNQLERFLDGGANSFLQVGTTMVLVTLAFFWVSPAVAVLAMLPIPVILLGSFAFTRKMGPRYASVRKKAALVNGQLANHLSGMATIQAFAAEEREAARLQGLSQDYQQANQHAISLSAAFSPLIRMAIVVGFNATLVVGGMEVIAGRVDVGSYSTLVFLTQRLLWPLTRLGETVDLYQRAMASTDRVLDLLHTQPALEDGEVPLDAPVGEIVFHDVGFAYPGRDPVLFNIQLRVPAGSTVAVVGSTGSGKSTLVRLLLRFYDPQEGEVTLDGRPLSSLVMADLRRSIGWVSQSTYLFSGTVAENLRMGRPDASFDEIRSAAEASEALGFIEALPQGFDTQVGERGVKLSGGQRQRLALARAVLKDPPILVLDEATSAVDNETEAAIQRSLERLSLGRTVFVIAHRLSTVRSADTIFVMEQGRVAERGTHDELVAQSGPYRRLWSIQTGETAF